MGAETSCNYLDTLKSWLSSGSAMFSDMIKGIVVESELGTAELYRIYLEALTDRLIVMFSERIPARPGAIVEALSPVIPFVLQPSTSSILFKSNYSSIAPLLRLVNANMSCLNPNNAVIVEPVAYTRTLLYTAAFSDKLVLFVPFTIGNYTIENLVTTLYRRTKTISNQVVLDMKIARRMVKITKFITYVLYFNQHGFVSMPFPQVLDALTVAIKA